MSKKQQIEFLDFGLPIIETHCHLDYLKSNSLEQILGYCEKVNIEKIITIAVEPSNLDTVIELSRKYPQVYSTQGIHPHEAKLYNQNIREQIIKNTKEDKVVAIGEIGLDYHYNHSSKKEQIDAFEDQLDIAISTNLPIVIHSREADQDMLAILKNNEAKIKDLVIHSYTSGIDLANYALEQNYKIGFNGIITFKNAQNVREILKLCPIKNILIETDSPFLAPIPHRGKENSPHYIPFVAQKIVEEKNIEIQELLEQCYKNSIDFFKL